MAILKAIDGTFYEVPDDQLENFKVPPEKVKDILAEVSQGIEAKKGPSVGPPPSAVVSVPPHAQVVVQVITNGVPQGGPPQASDSEGEVNPQGHCGWRNWRNCY